MTRERTNRPFLGTLPGLILGCLVSCGLWGSAYPCVKIGYELFGITGSDVASRLVFAGTRFTIAGIMVVVGVSIAQRRALLPAKRDLGAIGILALFQTVLQYFFFYGGLSHAAGVTSSIIGAAAYFFAILFAALIFKTEGLTRKAVIGCAIGFAGVVLVNLGGSGDTAFSFALNGEGFILLSSVAGAISTCFIAVLGRTHDSVLLSGWQFVTGGVVLLCCGLAMGGSLCPISPGPAFALILYMGFISAMAYTLWSRLLAANPVSRVSIFGFMTPVFGAAMSAVLLGETDAVNPLFALIALALVSAGIVIVNRPNSQ
ncbi:DMT family transporter [Collinsella sp. KGMB02528]|uniref:DMT family transporter n=1 Tax=Collinsella acetigenes TaxID=2713419 RepID=A0A7X9UCE4_9ACTN|nr:DMT family transporter [Collinsella acetigenes]NMF55883.1 DMT family transporter [Collinsella acetigenes]